MKKRILVADDEAAIRELLTIYLRNDGYDVDEATDGTEVLAQSENTTYDLIILDVMMPNMNGIDTCALLRARGVFMPILFLSARTEDFHKIEGLTVGADDYMTKPFVALELLARVKALLRRAEQYSGGARQGAESEHIFERDGLFVHFETRQVRVHGEDVRLTPKEFGILQCLASKPGTVWTLEQLYETVWGERFAVQDTSIAVHITNLRQKIEADPKNPRYVQTVWGVGYKL
ncbi:MAG: response regulator transcription factor [Bacilli bacterium]